MSSCIKSITLPFLMAFLVIAPAQALTIAIYNNAPPVEPVFRLVSSDPYDRQKLEESPETISLNFTTAPRTEKSAIKVFDMYGTRVDDGQVDGNGTKLSIPLPVLAPGKYRVKWIARCRCDQDTQIEDSFHFTVQ